MKLKTIGRGATVNIGNYENARIYFEFDISDEPCGCTEEGFKALDDWVKRYLQDRIEEIQELNGTVYPSERFTG
jgi:hypothetical protein